MSESKNSGRQSFRPIYPPDGIRETRILLAAAGHSPGDPALGNRSLASTTDADPVWKYRQSPVDLANLLVGQRMVTGLAVCGCSFLDGSGPGLSEGGRPGTARHSYTHGSDFFVGHIPFHVRTRHGSEPVGPRGANYSEVHLSEAAPRPLRTDRIQLDQRGVVVFDE